jgi:4-hydroxybutyrate CoA-transferase
MRTSTPREAWQSLAGRRVLLPSGCGFPREFVGELAGGEPLELVVGLVFGGYGFMDELPLGTTVATWQYAPGVSGDDRVRYLPLRYSQLIGTFGPHGAYPVDALVLHLSPPDPTGYCTLGVSPSYHAALLDRVPRLVGVVNQHMPATLGHRRVRVDQLEHLVELDAPLAEFARAPSGDVDAQVARNVASLVRDGATLQIGLGGIPEALPGFLSDREDLGLYGMLTDGGMELMRSGVVTGARFTPHPGAVQVGEIVGTRALFDFVDSNPVVRAVDVEYALSAAAFAQVPGLVALNSAIEVDLTGQVNAETIGHRIVSGAGGQCDYMQGAELSRGGLSVIALRSTTGSGRSRIVRSLAPGSVVTTPRTAVSHVVTEHGVAELRGRSVQDRIAALVAVAAPEHRSVLLKEED